MATICSELLSFIQVWVWPIVASILTVVLIYLLQKPRLSISIPQSESSNKAFGGKFVHLIVRNRSKGILGGGMANHCKGIITVNVEGEKKSFVTKWASKRDPISIQYFQISDGNFGGVMSTDLIGIQECKYEDFFPGERKKLDVAMKYEGESDCYIHEPENFLPNYTGRRKPENKLKNEKYVCEARIECSNGKSKPMSFTLINNGTTMESLSLDSINNSTDTQNSSS